MSEAYLGLTQKRFDLRYIQGYASPPDELFRDISEEQLVLQLARLRAWVQSLEGEPYGHEFYEAKSFVVKEVNTDTATANTFVLMTYPDSKCATPQPKRNGENRINQFAQPSFSLHLLTLRRGE